MPGRGTVLPGICRGEPSASALRVWGWLSRLYTSSHWLADSERRGSRCHWQLRPGNAVLTASDTHNKGQLWTRSRVANTISRTKLYSERECSRVLRVYVEAIAKQIRL